MKKRIFSALLAVCMVAGLFPAMTLPALAVETTDVLQDFSSSTSLTDNFNDGDSSPCFSYSNSVGLNGGGGVTIPLSTTEIWTTKQGYTLAENGVYSVSAYFKIAANAGFGGLGFVTSSSNITDPLTQTGAVNPNLGMGFHGGGGFFVNNNTSAAVSWPPDLVIGNWYKMIYTVTSKGSANYDIDFQIWNSDATGTLGTMKTETMKSVTNADVYAASTLHVYFSAAGNRMSAIDDFRIQLSGGAVLVQPGAPVITSNDGGDTVAISVMGNKTAVTTVSATDVDTASTISYSKAGGVDADKFSIDSSTGVLTFNTAPDYDHPTDTGSDNTYEVIVQASDNTFLCDTQTITVSVTPALSTTPTATTDAAGSITSTGATLNGTVNANNASTTVTFRYGVTTAYGTTVAADQSPVTGTSGTAVSKGITGLIPNTTYHYRVVGVNAAGTTNGLDQTFTTTSIVPTATTNAASSATSTGATLNGTVNANNASAVVTFDYGTSTSYGSSATAAQSPVTGTSVTSVNAALTGLPPNTTYHFRVKSVNTAGTTFGLDETFTTSASAPTVTSISPSGGPAAGGTSVTITGTNFTGASAVSFGGTAATSYTVNSATQITATAPAGSGTVNITVTTTGGTGTGMGLFTYVAASSGGSSGSSASSTPTQTSTVVEVNGQKQDAGTTSTATSGGQSVTTIKVDDTKLDKILENSGTKPIVTLPNASSDVVVGQMNGQTVKNMESKQAVLEIKTGTVSYTLPASQINIDKVSEQLGSQVALKDIKVSVSIAEPSADTVKVVQDTANKNSYQIVVKPVEFQITCTSSGKTVDVSKFNGYVERTVAIPAGVDPTKITTGIVLNTDGTFRHVPTTIIKMDGKYYAKINSLTNSTYSVIYNPVTFADVANHWAKTAINDMGSRMVMTGVGSSTYEPDRSINRAEFAAIVVRALGLAQGTKESSYGDVSMSDWFNGYVDTATVYGLITGYSDVAYGPNDTITREQAMAIIARAMKTTGLGVSMTDAEVSAHLSNYTDGTAVSDYAKAGVAACLKSGIVTGTSASTLSPKAYVTRAEVAVMVQHLLQKSGLI